MKRWAWIVAALYVLTLMVLTVPAGLLAFAPQLKLAEAAAVYGWWPYWLWLGVMFIGQFALLTVPVHVASLRPVTRGPVWQTILVGSLMAGGLVAAAVLSLYEFAFRLENGNQGWWTALGAGILAWCLWALVFSRISRDTKPTDMVSRLCRGLFQGSILELLIAVPTHVVARCRNYCCAGFMTFIGLAMGISVMLFSFGPAVFFLFVERWQRLHPAQADSPGDGDIPAK